MLQFLKSCKSYKSSFLQKTHKILTEYCILAQALKNKSKINKNKNSFQSLVIIF
jgi:hypothetical protein